MAAGKADPVCAPAGVRYDPERGVLIDSLPHEPWAEAVRKEVLESERIRNEGKPQPVKIVYLHPTEVKHPIICHGLGSPQFQRGCENYFKPLPNNAQFEFIVAIRDVEHCLGIRNRTLSAPDDYRSVAAFEIEFGGGPNKLIQNIDEIADALEKVQKALDNLRAHSCDPDFLARATGVLETVKGQIRDQLYQAGATVYIKSDLIQEPRTSQNANLLDGKTVGNADVVRALLPNYWKGLVEPYQRIARLVGMPDSYSQSIKWGIGGPPNFTPAESREPELPPDPQPESGCGCALGARP